MAAELLEDDDSGIECEGKITLDPEDYGDGLHWFRVTYSGDDFKDATCDFDELELEELLLEGEAGGRRRRRRDKVVKPVRARTVRHARLQAGWRQSAHTSRAGFPR